MNKNKVAMRINEIFKVRILVVGSDKGKEIFGIN